MRNLILSALLLSAFPLVSMGQVTEGQWTYIVENGGATITASTATGDVTIPSVLGGYAVKKVGYNSINVFGINNTSLTALSIPTSVNRIENNAFAGCSRLVIATIPSSVTSIGDDLFFGCTSLSTINLPNSVTSIGNNAFGYCRSLTSFTIPSNVTSIGSNAFSNCSNLTGTLNIPTSVTNIGSGAFSACAGLTRINVDSGNTNFSSDGLGVLFNKAQTILIQCPSGRTGLYIIPSSVTSIGEYAFAFCSGLTSITIPNSVTSIGSNAFGNCSGLTSITIPSSVTNIESNVFFGCSGLTSITIPSSVTNIESNAFFGCSGLTSITIPNSVTSIGFGAFFNCTKLVTVYLPARFADTYTNFGLTASQANFGIFLTASYNTSKGTILVNPNKLSYEAGESVVVTATPLSGYLFSNWSGASTATTSSITLTMDATKSVTASFNQDGRDNDGDGLTNYQESITYGTNPNVAETASPVAGLYLASQMQAMAIGDLVLIKNANGSFVLNYDIEQSTDLQTWTPYQALSLPLTGLPTDKAFVRIKMINSSPNPPLSTASGSNL